MFAQLVMGPAGSGKSTYCHALQQHGEIVGQLVHVVNLDPAAERFEYKPVADIRDLITVTDVAEELSLGPNGSLVYCMEYLLEDQDWLEQVLSETAEDDYLVFDMPGQIELYTHFECVRQFVYVLQSQFSMRVCSIFLLDAQFLADASKFFAGSLTAMAAMLHLGLPHLNVLSKVDLLRHRIEHRDNTLEPLSSDAEAPNSDEALDEFLERFLNPDIQSLVSELSEQMDTRYRALNERIGALLEDYAIVQFVPYSATDEDSIGELLLRANLLLQYDDDRDVRIHPELD
jgi:GTPase SAR1 family protein